MRRIFAIAVAGGLGMLSALPAVAIPITYEHTGSGSGSIDGVPFGLSSFVINALGDTDNVESCGGGCLFNDNLTASITIDGLGTFSFITATRFFSNLGGGVGFSRGGLDGLDLFHGPSLAGWDMLSSVGPIFGPGLLLQWDLGDVLTDGGVLLFNDGSTDSTFTATVPEPGTLALLGLGLLGLGVVRRRAA